MISKYDEANQAAVPTVETMSDIKCEFDRSTYLNLYCIVGIEITRKIANYKFNS